MTWKLRWPVTLALLAGVPAAAWWLASPALPASPPMPLAPTAAGPAPAGPAVPAAEASGPRRGTPFTALALAQRREQLALERAGLARAQQTLASYRLATRYPYDSRPASEHEDQWIAHPLLASDGPLRMPGGAAAAGVHVHTTQQAVFASGSQAVALTVAVLDDQGNALPLRILSSATQAVVDGLAPQRTAPSPPTVTQVFTDDGSQGDGQSGDGTWSTRLQPAAEGFGNWAGVVRTELLVAAADAQGYVAFDLVYSPGTPATWSGAVQESLANGSLVLALPLDVAQPGRYVVTGRIDDADGKPFALLSFNDELGTGAQQVRLTLWGRLVQDQKPAFPLTLHDVDGFLLKADTFPDRALLPPREGVVHTTRRYTLASFGDAPWESEETARYIGEFTQDVASAQARVDQLERQTGP